MQNEKWHKLPFKTREKVVYLLKITLGISVKNQALESSQRLGKNFNPLCSS